MPLGPPQQYLAKYNTYILPGYVQNESFNSVMDTADHSAPYADGSNTEQMGLANKVLNLRLKVWETDYLTCKEQVRQAATMLRSKKQGFANLYVQDNDKHYEAIVKTITEDKEAGTAVRILEYNVEFECKPWVVSDTITTISGTGLLTTDSIGRTIDDGGWSPTVITVTGADITVSGYTDIEPFTGFISISGAVSNLVVDSYAFTATMGGNNANSLIPTVDYRVYTGPEKTYFQVDGASNCTISWYNRWYL